MAEIELMRCTQPYWFAKNGVDTLMAAGTILPKGHPDIAGRELYWEPYEIEQITTTSSRRAHRKG